MNKNTYTLEKIEQIIDSHMTDFHNFAFVVNYDLADEISDYLADTYDIEDDENALYDETDDSDSDEFILMVSFRNKGTDFNCANARHDNGRWILCEDKDIDYYISLDMTDSDIKTYLSGIGNLSWTRFDYLGDVEILDDSDYEDEDSCDGDCETCPDNPDIPDEVKERIRIIANVADRIADMECHCPHCVMEELIRLAKTFEQIGYDNAKDEMQAMLDCMDEE